MRRPSSDWINPVLIKELRQGIRSKMFIGSFLLIQLLLFLYGTALLTSDGLRQDSSEVALFWTALSLPLLLLVPAMAGQAIEKEVNGGTLELLLVTRLSSQRLVIGKWASVVVRSTLLVTSALPYLMLRYFLGGIDIWGELRAFGILVLASALLAGITMGFWATKLSKLVKFGAVLAVFTVVPYMFVMFFAYRGGFFASGMGAVIWFYGLLAMLMMLTLAASRIGPPAENHTTKLRVLALLGGGAALGFRSTHDVRMLSAIFALVILVPVVIGALNERIRPVPRLYAPFAKRTGLLRWLAMPLAPGWPGGLAFACLVFALVPLFRVWIDDFKPFVLVAVVGTFLAPAAILHTSLSEKRRSVVVFLVLIVLSTVPLYVYGFAHAFGNDLLVLGLESILGFFPPAALAFELWEIPGYPATVAVLELGLVTSVSLYVLIRAARREWTAIAERSRSDAAQPALSAVAPVVEGSPS